MTLENFFKVFLILVFTTVWVATVWWVCTHQLDPVATFRRLIRKPLEAPAWVAIRDPNKIYQRGNVVGEVTGEVQEQGSTVRFAQLANTEALDQSATFQYQRYDLRIVQIGVAIGMKTEVQLSGSGAVPRVLTAVLENVVCEESR